MSRKSQRIQCMAGSMPNILNRKRKIGALSPEAQSVQESLPRKRLSCHQSKPLQYKEDSSEDEHYPSDPEWMTSQLTRQYSQLTCLPSPPSHDRHPLPDFCWADPTEVWNTMIEKESFYRRDPHCLERHPALHARMRAIVLDWLMEVCDAYKLRRETYYLALDYIDRFLASQHNFLKHQLQLIGITALFIASKIEEIYPPKLTEFAFVTDGACSTSEIITQEMIILKALKWEITPMTAYSWLNTYMQLSNKEKIARSKENFVFPNYAGIQFVQIAKLVDLCTLDVESLQFSYRAIAASALYHMTSPGLFASVTGLRPEEVHDCIAWLVPFSLAVRESGMEPVKHFSQVTKDDMHNIQTHTFDISLLEMAHDKQSQILSSSKGSPMSIAGILTPPQSREK